MVRTLGQKPLIRRTLRGESVDSQISRIEGQAQQAIDQAKTEQERLQAESQKNQLRLTAVQKAQNRVKGEDNRIKLQQQRIDKHVARMQEDKAKGFEFWKSVRKSRFKQLDALYNTLNQLNKERNQAVRQLRNLEAGLPALNVPFSGTNEARRLRLLGINLDGTFVSGGAIDRAIKARRRKEYADILGTTPQKLQPFSLDVIERAAKDRLAGKSVLGIVTFSASPQAIREMAERTKADLEKIQDDLKAAKKEASGQNLQNINTNLTFLEQKAEDFAKRDAELNRRIGEREQQSRDRITTARGGRQSFIDATAEKLPKSIRNIWKSSAKLQNHVIGIIEEASLAGRRSLDFPGQIINIGERLTGSIAGNIETLRQGQYRNLVVNSWKQAQNSAQATAQVYSDPETYIYATVGALGASGASAVLSRSKARNIKPNQTIKQGGIKYRVGSNYPKSEKGVRILIGNKGGVNFVSPQNKIIPFAKSKIKKLPSQVANNIEKIIEVARKPLTDKKARAKGFTPRVGKRSGRVRTDPSRSAKREFRREALIRQAVQENPRLRRSFAKLTKDQKAGFLRLESGKKIPIKQATESKRLLKKMKDAIPIKGLKGLAKRPKIKKEKDATKVEAKKEKTKLKRAARTIDRKLKTASLPELFKLGIIRVSRTKQRSTPSKVTQKGTTVINTNNIRVSSTKQRSTPTQVIQKGTTVINTNNTSLVARIKRANQRTKPQQQTLQREIKKLPKNNLQQTLQLKNQRQSVYRQPKQRVKDLDTEIRFLRSQNKEINPGSSEGRKLRRIIEIKEKQKQQLQPKTTQSKAQITRSIQNDLRTQVNRFNASTKQNIRTNLATSIIASQQNLLAQGLSFSQIQNIVEIEETKLDTPQITTVTTKTPQTPRTPTPPKSPSKKQTPKTPTKKQPPKTPKKLPPKSPPKKQPPKTPTKKQTPRRPPKVIPLLGKDKQKGLQQGFVGQVRVKGSWKDATRPTTPNRALKGAMSIADNTVAVSVRVLPKGKIKKQKDIAKPKKNKFKKSKRETGVKLERRKFRIDSLGEKRGITFKGLQTPRKRKRKAVKKQTRKRRKR